MFNLDEMRGLFLVSLFCWSVSAFGQNPTDTLWSGDVNNNGIVNGMDLLYMASVYGEQGDSRPNASSEWLAQAVPGGWASVLPGTNNLSAAFADCNGDGLVDTFDQIPIAENYGETHGSQVPSPIVSSPNMGLAFISALDQSSQGQPTFGPGENSVFFDLTHTDGILTPLENVYGVRFVVKVQSPYVVPSGLDFTFEPNSWMGPLGGDLMTAKYTNTPGEIEIVLARTGASISGSGDLGQIRFIIEDNVPDFAPNEELLSIEGVYVLNKQMERIYEVSGGTFSANIDGTTSSANAPTLPGVNVYPNPVSQKGILRIEGLRQYPQATVTLRDFAGRRQPLSPTAGGWDVSRLSAGVYVLEIQTAEGRHLERLIIH